MAKPLLLGLMVLLCVTPVRTQEKVTLTTPEVRTTTEYQLTGFSAFFDDPSTASVDEGVLTVELRGQNTEVVTCTYRASTSPTATFLNTALQKANLSTAYAGNGTTGSLKHRVCHRLIVMGEAAAVCGRALSGTCTGAVP